MPSRMGAPGLHVRAKGHWWGPESEASIVSEHSRVYWGPSEHHSLGTGLGGTIRPGSEPQLSPEVSRAPEASLALHRWKTKFSPLALMIPP